MVIPKGIPARGKRGRSGNGIAVLSDGSVGVSQWIQQSHMVQRKNYEAAAKAVYVYSRAYIYLYLYYCDKIIDSNGTEHFSYFFPYVLRSLRAAPFYSPEFILFRLFGSAFRSKRAASRLCAVMMSLYGTGCRTYSSIKMQRQTNGNIIKIYYVLQPLRWRSQDRRRRRWYPCCWRYCRRIESSVTERSGKLKSFENIRVEL